MSKNARSVKRVLLSRYKETPECINNYINDDCIVEIINENTGDVIAVFSKPHDYGITFELITKVKEVIKIAEYVPDKNTYKKSNPPLLYEMTWLFRELIDVLENY